MQYNDSCLDQDIVKNVHVDNGFPSIPYFLLDVQNTFEQVKKTKNGKKKTKKKTKTKKR